MFEKIVSVVFLYLAILAIAVIVVIIAIMFRRVANVVVKRVNVPRDEQSHGE